jgi:Cytochrome c554 and c-prime
MCRLAAWSVAWGLMLTTLICSAPMSETMELPARRPSLSRYLSALTLRKPTPQFPLSSSRDDFVGDLACRPCHSREFTSYLATAHHRSSRLPDVASVAGNFAHGNDVMTTFNPELTFHMEVRDGGFYETAIRRKDGRTTRRTERIDLVIGSATKGQTYLYWKQNGLFELPVSYWTQLHRWVNSPGYVDGSADFERPVLPRCLECHATYVQPITSSISENHYDKDNITLGISCERCHGPGEEHVVRHSKNSAAPGSGNPMPPLGLSRERQIDICAQCHGGAGEPVAPAFSFKPGDPLSQFIRLQPPTATDRLDVHGNQVNLLERSRCFQGSSEMSCSTCHDLHMPEHPAAYYSNKCLGCHRIDQCGMVRKIGTQAAANCIDCHMPVQSSNVLVVDTENSRLAAQVRNHWIRVYPNASLPNR